jgi:hypothetical protein
LKAKKADTSGLIWLLAADPQIVYNLTQSIVGNRQNVYHIQNNGTNVSSASNLGVVQQTIGSPRLIQMSLRINF